MAQILMVEDSPSNAELYATFLRAGGHGVTLCGSGADALAVLAGRGPSPDLMVLDLGLPDMDGLEILRRLGPAGIPPTIVLTGSGSVRRAVEAMREGALDFLVKPCSADKLRAAVEEALERRAPRHTRPIDDGDRLSVPTRPTAAGPEPGLSQSAGPEPGLSQAAAGPAGGATPGGNGSGRNPRAGRPRRGPSGFLGSSPAMSNVFSLIEAAAASSNASVFITGETGTGKELCANAIHNLSERRNGPFVALNCGAIPRDLMESEVFGHRKGAFTGAVADQEGAASRADGGTLFLDELCEMDLDLQVKLLRFIQTNTYRRVGDAADREADIRFVCATNRDPLAEVKAGRFREDLYYRLYVVPIHLPPLRERGGDVDMLARRFLADFAALEGKTFVDFAPEALARIRTHSWPGNVRQLENVIRTIVVLHDGPLVTLAMLPAPLGVNVGGVDVGGVDVGGVDVGGACAPGQRAMGGGAPEPGPALDAFLARPLVELEAMAIDAALRLTGNNVTQAAHRLGVSPSTIYRKHPGFKSRIGPGGG